MGVLNGQPVNQTVTNAAFINKNQADQMPFPLSFTKTLSGAMRDESSAATINSLNTTVSNIRVSATVTNINGAAVPATYSDGAILLITNAKTSGTITLAHESASAGAATERFNFPNATSVVLQVDQSILLAYDATDARWKSYGMSGGYGYFSGLSNTSNTLLNNVGASNGTYSATDVRMNATATGAGTYINWMMNVGGNGGNPIISSGITNSGSYGAINAIGQRTTGTDFGTLTALYGAYVQAGHASGLATTAVTTSCYGIRISKLQGATSTITNHYGLFLETSGTGTTVTNSWAIYSTDSAASFLGGGLRLSTTNNITVGSVNGIFQVNATAANGSSGTFARFSADASPPYIGLGKSRGGTVGTYTAVTANDELGRLEFSGADGTNLSSAGVRLGVFVDGTVSTGIVPSRFVISTNNGTAMGERIRVDNTGRLGVGQTNPTSLLHVGGPIATAVTSTAAASYNVLASDSTILLTATTGTATAVLPSAVNIAGRIYTIKRTGTGGTSYTVSTTSSQTIDGALTYTFAAQYNSVTVQSDGANWVILNT